MSRDRIVVGVDGSPASLAAVRWALGEATGRGTAVHLLYAQPPVPWRSDRLQAEAEDVLSALVAQAHRLAPAVPTTGAVAPHGPVPALLDAAGQARLLVLGASHAHDLTRLGLSRVSTQVALLATCPVTVVPASYRPDARPGPVVVGVDSSGSAALALRYALVAAERRHVGVVAVHAWRPAFLGLHRLRQLPDSFDHLAETHGRVLSHAVHRWQPTFPGTPVTQRLALGDTHHALLAAAARGSLLVIGSRGWGSLRGALAGSVGLHLLPDAPLPVVVVHPYRSCAPTVPTGATR
jgi:nucleotide-binding universal stress UspA family protein